MVRLVRSQFRAHSLPVGRESPDTFDAGVSSVFPRHLKKASIAIDDLDSLSYASKKHDQDFIDDLNTRSIMDNATSYGLPPRARRHHVVSSVTPTVTHSSRNIISYGDTGDSYARGYSLPPATYRSTIDTSPVVWPEPPRSHRRLSLADTAVRHAHMDVDRVERELSNREDPRFASIRRMAPVVNRHRSLSYHGPRASSLALVPHVSEPVAHTSILSDGSADHQAPSYYHYYYHREQPVNETADEGYGYYKRHSLYSPASLVRCLTATPVMPARKDYYYRNDSHVEPTYRPSVLSAVVSQPASVRKLQRSTSYHGPRFYKTSSSYDIPDSVGHWYYRTPNAAHISSTVDSSFRQRANYVPLARASSYTNLYSTAPVRLSSPPSTSTYDYSYTAPKPPYETRVYTAPSEGRHISSNYYSYNTSGLPYTSGSSYTSGLPYTSPSYLSSLPSSSSSSYEYHHHARPQVTSYVTRTPVLSSYVSHTPAMMITHSPAKVTRTTYSSSSSSSAAPLLAQHGGHITVSDTRRKVRDVLCKVKKDPTYFDD